MVFAAGLGTRMRPLTDTLPKPLVEIGGVTMLDHMLDRLAEAGVERAIVNVHHLAEQIEGRVAGRRQPAVTISDERALLLDQAGGIVKALRLLGDDPFFICNTDAVWIEGSSPSLQRLAAGWDPDRMDVALLVAATATSIGVDWQGDFLMESDGRLIKRPENQPAPFVYAGVGIIKPELFAGLPEAPIRLAPYFFAAAEQGRLYGARLEGTWLHVGTPATIAEAELAYAASARSVGEEGAGQG